MFEEIDRLDTLIREKAKSMIDVFHFDVIRIINLDISNSAMDVAITFSKNSTAESRDFSYFNISEIIQVLTEKKEMIILDKDHQQYIQDDIHIYNILFNMEVYLPFFNSDYETKGFIYFARKDAIDMRNDTNLMNTVKLLVHANERKLHHTRMQESLYETVLMLCEIVNAKQPYLIGNLSTVYHWANKIAMHMNLSAADIRKLHLATLMHDLGKIYIEETILNKTGKLTEAEYGIVKTRVSHSYEIALKISNIYPIEDIPQIILNYQERIDGKGYPNGIKGVDIPLLSRILYVAKAMSAMLSNTMYRKAMPIDEIIRELKNNSGTQFDMEVAEAAIVLLIYKKGEIEDYFSGLGTYATLSLTFRNSDSVNMWGSVRKKGNQFQFTPIETLPDFELGHVTTAWLFLSLDDKIMKFKPEIIKANKRSIFISKLIIQEDEKTFSINWFMEAEIIVSSQTRYRGFIILVGGDFLDFYVFADEVNEPITGGVFAVKLSIDHVAHIPGVVVFQQRINEKIYHRFEYRGLPEAEQKRIFSAIFGKQIETKKLLKDTGYFQSRTG